MPALLTLMDNLRSRVLPSLLVAAAALAAVAASGCGLLDDAAFIAFTAGAPGERDIVVIHPRGTDRQVVTNNGVGQRADDYAPVWAPDGKRLAFLSNREGNYEIYVAIADGSRVMRVTDTAVDESQVVWAPDGNRLAYTSPTIDGLPAVYWLSLSDLLPNRLLFGSAGETDPAWSPDGRWVAFASLDENGDPAGLFLRNPDGVNRLQISESPDRSPAWSPDGRRLAFVSTRDGSENIYVIEIGEEGPIGQATPVTDTPGRDFAPDWAPNNSRITFLSDRNGNVDIYTVTPTGEDVRMLTRNEVDETSVRWGADGRLVFASSSTGVSHLFIINTDGTQYQVTTGGSPATLPDW